jgi:hypothetical protein
MFERRSTRLISCVTIVGSGTLLFNTLSVYILQKGRERYGRSVLWIVKEHGMFERKCRKRHVEFSPVTMVGVSVTFSVQRASTLCKDEGRRMLDDIKLLERSLL